MTAVAKTYTFVSATKARASQVNQNFDDLVNALTLRNRDVKIGSLAVGTAATTGSMVISDTSGVDTYFISPITSSIALTTPINVAGAIQMSISAHGLVEDQMFSFGSTGGQLHNDLFICQPYWAYAVTTNNFKLRKEPTGANFTTYGAFTSSSLIELYKGGAQVTLPTLADNQGRIITVYKNNSAKDLVVVAGENGEKLSGLKAISIYNKDTFLRVIGETTEWKVLNYPTRILQELAFLSGNCTLKQFTITVHSIMTQKDTVINNYIFPNATATGNSAASPCNISWQNLPKALTYSFNEQTFSLPTVKIAATYYPAFATGSTGYNLGLYLSSALANFSLSAATISVLGFHLSTVGRYFGLTTAAGELVI